MKSREPLKSAQMLGASKRATFATIEVREDCEFVGNDADGCFLEIPSNLVLITGINGFIGSHIAKILVERGFKVRGLVRKTSNLQNISNLLARRGGKSQIELIHGDIRDRNCLDHAFTGVSICFHTAALVKAGNFTSQEYFSTNLQGTINVCNAAMVAGIQSFIYTSTCETLRGKTFANMMGDYGRSKFLAEEHVKSCVPQGLPAVILNPTAVLGSCDVNVTPPTSLVLDYASGKIPFYFETGFNTVDVRDVATAHVAALHKGKIGERYVIGGRNVYLSELFGIIKKVTGKRPFSMRLPYSLIAMLANFLPGQKLLKEKIKASRKPLFFDTSKAEIALGFRPQFDLEATLKDHWIWYKHSSADHTSLHSSPRS